jgi:hypothetical protein
MVEKQIELRVTSVSRLEAEKQTSVPLYLCRVSAGFPSPASDYVDYVESRVNVYLMTGIDSIGNSRRTSLFNSRGVGPAGVGTSTSCA